MQSSQPVDVPTPRTDAMEKRDGIYRSGLVGVAFARQLERELSAVTTELERTKEQLRVAREAISDARNKFKHYATLHFMKDTPEGDSKGRRNELMADKMRDALNFTQPKPSADSPEGADPVKAKTFPA